MSQPIPLLDIGAQHAPLLDDLRSAVDRVLTSGRFIMGPEVEGLEREIAELTGVPHAIGVSSGTDALLVSLMALGVGPGDEVVTTPFSFFATAGCVARLGATPVFADIEPDTFNLDPERAREVITDKTRAILPVHLFGQPADMDPIRSLSAERDLPIIEDAAQALGAYLVREDGTKEPVGKLGTTACFSFFPSKNLGAAGDGGLVTAEDDALAAHLRSLRAHGAKPKYYHAHIGGNFRLDALQAAILRVKLPYLATWTEGRRRNAERYDELFRDKGIAPDTVRTPHRAMEGHVYNQYVIRVDRRDELRQHLKDQGIATEVYYPVPLHRQECFAYLGYGEGTMPEAEQASREVLALPVYPELPEGAQERIVDTIAAFYR